MPPDTSQTGNQRPLRQNVLLILLSVTLSGAVAFGVARYTVAHDDRLQDEAAAKQRIVAVYIPLNSAISQVVACVPLNACSDTQVYQAGRAANRAVIEAHNLGSTRVGDLATRVQGPLGDLVEHRLRGERPSNALTRRAAERIVALTMRISKELDR